MTQETQYEMVMIHVRRFQPFYGANYKMMQGLLTGKDKDGNPVDVTRSPISPKRLMELRLGYVGSEADKIEFRNNYVDTSLAVLPDPNSDEVIFSNRPPLIYQLNEDTRLVGGNLEFDGDVYAEAKKSGFTINASDANTLRNNTYALPKLRREAWEFFAEGDTEITEAYAADVTKTTRLEFDKVMGLYLPRSKGLRLLYVWRLGGRSNANGDGSLADDNGRLVGEAPEALVRKNGSSDLEHRVEFSQGGSVVEVDGVAYVLAPKEN